MSWVEAWRQILGDDPIDPTSREVSVQDVLAELIVGRRPLWFEKCELTAGGHMFITRLWEMALGSAPEGRLEWFVNEYALPVPPEWREEIGLTYGCPDFACRCGFSVLIVELKTETGSYRAQQMPDYSRLARRLHPDDLIDLVLLGPSLPGYQPPCDDRQRYVELTWAVIPELITRAFAGQARAAKLAEFISTSLPAPPIVATTAAAAIPSVPQQWPPFQDLVLSATAHARRMAPSVAQARRNDVTERGIDVRLPSDHIARKVQTEVKSALEREGYSGRVSVWLWRPSSLGVPTTPAGQELGRELRLAPVFATRPASA